MKIAFKLLLVAALVGSVGPAQVAEGRVPLASRLGRAWQSTKLVFSQAARQVKMIKGNPSLGRWTKARKSFQAVARSLCARRPPAVLLYQGAFDPVHNGHVTNLEAALAGVKNVKQVYLVPTSEHPGKTPVDHGHRVAMLRGALCERGLPSLVTVVDDRHLSRLSLAGFDDLTTMIHTRHPAPGSTS